MRNFAVVAAIVVFEVPNLRCFFCFDLEEVFFDVRAVVKDPIDRYQTDSGPFGYLLVSQIHFYPISPLPNLFQLYCR